ncbi:MAG: lactate racemase domain-containing protein [bacterium]
MDFPRFYKVRQNMECPVLRDVEGAVRDELSRIKLQEQIKPGTRVAITAGSRGIANMPLILKTVAAFIRAAGAEPFLVPAMGSHGGATAEGQLGILESLGITEESMGVPIISSMEVVEIGRTEQGIPVYFDKNAWSADAVFVVNRVKPHTGFRAANESGLVKMISVGLGKERGCTTMHQSGLAEAIPAAARVSLATGRIIGGLGIVENSQEETAEVRATLAADLMQVDAELLVKAKAYLPQLPFDDIDVLVVDEMGKNISGTGMDVNVIGRMYKLGIPEPERPRVKRIVVLDLTEASHGNALGMGLADVTTKRFVSKIDIAATYANVIAAGVLERGRTPVSVENDREALRVALSSLTGIAPEAARVVRIKNTLELQELQVSEALFEEVKAHPRLELLGESAALEFDAEGNLK